MYKKGKDYQIKFIWLAEVDVVDIWTNWTCEKVHSKKAQEEIQLQQRVLGNHKAILAQLKYCKLTKRGQIKNKFW